MPAIEDDEAPDIATVSWELHPAAVAAIFAMRGWSYIDGQPDTERIEGVVDDLIRVMAEDPRLAFRESGRLHVRRLHPKAAVADLYLRIGTVEFIMENPDEPSE